MTSNRKYSFSIDYDAILDNGLKSKAGGWGRGLQNLAIILGEAGHKIDVYTQQPNSIKEKYKNVSFLEYGVQTKKEYDIVLWNGWVTDTPTQTGKLYFYLEFFRNWESRFLQKEWLRKDNVFVGYPFKEESILFSDPVSEFKDKSILFPYPVITKFSDKNNFFKDGWACSLKPYQYPHSFKENFESMYNHMLAMAKERNKKIIHFPRGNEPLENVFSALEQTQILFPFGVSGSTIEAVATGVVSLPVFKAEPHANIFLPFGQSSQKAQTYLEYPITKERLEEVVNLVTSNEEKYQSTITILREELIPNQFDNAVIYIENLIGSII